MRKTESAEVMEKTMLLGEADDLQCIQQLVSLDGLQVLDVGCGDGSLARAMAAKGAIVTGIEPDAVQAERNRLGEVVEGVQLLEAGADAIPVKNGAYDLAVLCYSLHHIPQGLYTAVFKELSRVLLAAGQLLVLEPVADGSAQYVMELFHDETLVRQQAQVALKVDASPYFSHQQTAHYDVVKRFASFSDYVKNYGFKSYNDYQAERVAQDIVRQRFEQFCEVAGKQAKLIQPIKADLFIKK